MKQLEQVRLTPEFLDGLDPIWSASVLYAKRYMEIYGEEKANYYSRAYSWDGTPVACWGIFKDWEAVGAVYIVFDKSIRKCLKSIVKQGREDLNHAMDSEFRRLAAIFQLEAPTLPMMKRFGFEYCGTYRNYGEGGQGTYFAFERIKD